MEYIKTSEQKISKFRLWLVRTWPNHCDEVLSWEGIQVTYSINDWIKKNKWFLARQYQHETSAPRYWNK